jgi:hypothetical protein
MYRYKHEKTGNYYTSINEDAKMKVGDNWVKCVVYKNDNGEVFVREAEDFFSKFTVA